MPRCTSTGTSNTKFLMHVTVYEHETKHLLEMDKAQELVHLIRIDLITSLVMALVATGENGTSTPSTLKAKNDDSKVVYSPSIDRR